MILVKHFLGGFILHRAQLYGGCGSCSPFASWCEPKRTLGIPIVTTGKPEEVRSAKDQVKTQR